MQARRTGPTPDKFFEFGVSFGINHIGGWRVAYFIRVEQLVRLDIAHLTHVL